MTSIIFLLGAGASRDAGMPLVSELTSEIRASLPGLRDPAGECGEAASDLFEEVAKIDQRVAANYEAFFEWLAYLRQATKEPFSLATKLNLNVLDIGATASCIAWSVKGAIIKSLVQRHCRESYDPAYLAGLADFVPLNRRLHVFTTNYDSCVEDACRSCGLDIRMGFSARSGRWTPSVFRARSPGVNLYKLHGSLNWAVNADPEAAAFNEIIECRRFDPNVDPELVLGPGPKLQSDEPFVTLYAEFHRALSSAKVCILIGCSLEDDHIRNPIRRANQHGMSIVEVNPSPAGYAFGGRIKTIQAGAKDAFENGHVLDVVSSLVHRH